MIIHLESVEADVVGVPVGAEEVKHDQGPLRWNLVVEVAPNHDG